MERNVRSQEVPTIALSRGLLIAVTAIACMSVGGCWSAEPALKIGEERVIFTGTVEEVRPIEQHDVFPVSEYPPRFLLAAQAASQS
jgi:hypothetical protein